jgi:hypothetical protein
MGKAVFVLFSLTFILGLSAQTPPAEHSSGRYLLIVDTSAAMRRRAPAVQKAVSNLLLSSMHTQLRRGDTVGLWTYNEQLYAGRLPLQQWTPEREQLVASNILAFLKAQPCEKTSRLDTVWPALQSVVEESEKLTVLLISDGDKSISGTPFDREINEFFKINSRSQKQKRMPFVTVLRSRRGDFIGASLNLAPWPVEFPPFPPEPKVAAAPKPKSPPEKTAPRPATPPLIVIGKKPEPVAVTPVAAFEPTPAKPAALTNAMPVAVVEPKSPPEPATPETPKPAPTEAAPVTVQPAATPVAPTEAAPAPGAATDQPKPDFSTVATPPEKPVVAPRPPVVELPKPMPMPVVVPPETKPASPPVVAPPTEPSHASAPTPVALPAHADNVKPEPSPPPATVRQPFTTPPAQVATATQPETIFNRTKLLLTAGVLLVLGVTFLFLKQRRARAGAHASLITRSMDQDKK